MLNNLQVYSALEVCCTFPSDTALYTVSIKKGNQINYQTDILFSSFLKFIDRITDLNLFWEKYWGYGT